MHAGRLLSSALMTLAVALWAATSADAGANYTYDALGRVISVRYDDGKQIVYQYDAAGNRTQHVVSATTVNRAPVTTPDAVTLTEDQSSVTFNPRTNDSDPDGHPLTLFSASAGAFGSGALSGGGTTVTYSSTHKRTATDNIVYTVGDGQGMQGSGDITIALANLNPVAVNDAVTMSPNTSMTLDPRGNDSDPGGDTFTVTAVSPPSHGTTNIISANTLWYQPTTGYTGADSFTYTITDIDGGTATGTVNVTVANPPQPPVAVNDTSGVMGGQTRTFDPRVNDSDPEGGALTITAKTNGAHGTVTINSGTSVSYAAQTGWTGNDTFTYTITDPQSLTATATVTMSVSATNRAPTAVTDTMVYNGNWIMGDTTPFKPTITIDPRPNDTDPDGHALTVTAKTNGAIGAVTLSSNNLTWTKNTNVTGPGTWNDSFTYTISDGNGGTATGTVNVAVELGCVNGSQECP